MATRVRRTQEERTAETRTALMEAAVSAVYRLGYGGATTAIIADEAGVSRGALTHHFGSRAELMATVVQWVYDKELELYRELLADGVRGTRVSDWPDIVWEVLSKPSGLAVLEILQATRSDAELAERVKPVQIAIEQTGIETMQARFGGDDDTRRATVRLVIWAIRGLTIEQMLVPDPAGVKASVDVLRLLLERAAPSGSIDDLRTSPAAST